MVRIFCTLIRSSVLLIITRSGAAVIVIRVFCWPVKGCSVPAGPATVIDSAAGAGAATRNRRLRGAIA